MAPHGGVFGHHIVTEVLAYKHFAVLVIDDFSGHAAKVVEGQMMGIDCCLCSEWSVL